MEEKEIKYNSITYGQLTEEELFKVISEYVADDMDYLITVGTDSQSYSRTKVVTVIAIHRVGKGGIFFHSTEYMPHMENVRLKVYNETYRSIELTKRLTAYLYDKGLDFDIVIHVDIGRSKRGKTAELIHEIMGWVTAEGFKAEHKPDSYTASCIADRLSK